MPEKVKLFFRLSDDAPYGTESVWSGYSTKESLIVLNSPFYVKGVSCLDEVHFTKKDGLLYFENVIKKSGHSTYRILQQTSEQKRVFDKFWKPLQDIGCSFESKIDAS